MIWKSYAKNLDDLESLEEAVLVSLPGNERALGHEVWEV